MTKSKSRNLARIVLSIPFILMLLVIVADAQGDKVTSPQPASRDIVTSLPAVSSNTQTDRLPTGVPADIRAHEARISPGDVVDVKIFGLPEMSQELRVSDAGIIVLPLIGSITAQGLTTSDLEHKISEALRNGGFVNDPQVNVSAKELHSSGVSVSGEVGKPGIYPVFGSCSLPDLIMAAGGLTPKAGHLVTVTHRDQPDAPINVDISFASVNSGQNVAVFSGDAVVVTKAGVVYVLGDVSHPAGFVMEGDEKMTVLRALALAGGPNKDAKIKSARVIRKSPTGVQGVPIPLKEILSAHRQDMELQAGDVLFIPARNSDAFWRGEGYVLQTVTMLAVFRP